MEVSERGATTAKITINSGKSSREVIDLTDPELYANFVKEEVTVILPRHDQNAQQSPHIKLEDQLRLRESPGSADENQSSNTPESIA